MKIINNGSRDFLIEKSGVEYAFSPGSVIDLDSEEATHLIEGYAEIEEVAKIQKAVPVAEPAGTPS